MSYVTRPPTPPRYGGQTPRTSSPSPSGHRAVTLAPPPWLRPPPSRRSSLQSPAQGAQIPSFQTTGPPRRPVPSSSLSRPPSRASGGVPARSQSPGRLPPPPIQVRRPSAPISQSPRMNHPSVLPSGRLPTRPDPVRSASPLMTASQVYAVRQYLACTTGSYLSIKLIDLLFVDCSCSEPDSPPTIVPDAATPARSPPRRNTPVSAKSHPRRANVPRYQKSRSNVPGTGP